MVLVSRTGLDFINIEVLDSSKEEMIFCKKKIVFTYHGLHTRKLINSIDNKLFRNSIYENDYLCQLRTLKEIIKSKRGKDTNVNLMYEDSLFNEFKIFLTFDDGYKNNFRASEIFYDVFGFAPFTVFLTTNLINNSNRSIWTVDVALLILRGEFANYKIDFGKETFFLNNCQDRLDCFNIIRQKLKKMNARERKYYCDLITNQSLSGEMDRLMFEYPEFQMLKLDEIKEMQRMGVKFEPHGHNHEILHSGQTLEVIKSEITNSKEFIETNLNQKCIFFAYPNGDYCASTISLLKENGFRGAYTTRIGIAKSLENNFEIPRLTPNPKPNKFKKQLRGSVFEWNRLLRLYSRNIKGS